MFTRSRRFLFALSLCAACLATSVAAQVYKWVDEKGVTHYSESPPEQAKDRAKKIDTKSASGPAGGSPKTAKSASDLELEFRQRQTQRDQQARKDAQQNERQQANCADARRQLATLNEQIALFRRNERGERVYLEDSERQAEAARVKNYIDRNC